VTFLLISASGVWAQCRDTFNIPLINPPFVPAAFGFPLGIGATLSSFTSTMNTINTAFLTSTSAFVSAPGGPQPDQQGGGAWSRVVAGTVETNTSSVGTITAPVGFPPVTGAQNCDVSTRQNYVGYQAGRDISILNAGGTGANWHFGVTAGYLQAYTKDTTPAGTFVNPIFGPADTPAGTFKGNTQVPFAGIYAAYTKGNFGLDAQVRWDFYQNNLSDPFNNLTNQQLNGRGISLTANALYNMPLKNNWFIEPSAGVVWSRVQIDPLNVPGFFPVVPIGTGTVNVDDIESVLGRASLRVGTTISGGAVTWQPYFTASIFHEFAGDVTARSVSANFPGFVLTQKTEGGVGTYGQFALGTAAVLGNTGWLAYARGDYRIGDVIEGWGINAGLRYQFSPEQRASIKDAPAPSRGTYNWTGFYLGQSSGAAWGRQEWSTPAIGTHDHPDFEGYLISGHGGYNLQLGRIVIGVEGDYGFANARGGKSCDDLGGPAAFFFTCQGELQKLGMVTGRVGHTWGRALFYGKGGLAFGEVRVETSQNAGAAVPPSGTPVNGETKWLTGWTVGGGMEFALSDRWSARAEYMHYDLGSANFNIDNGFVADAATRGETVRLGASYHFHRPEPVPLK